MIARYIAAACAAALLSGCVVVRKDVTVSSFGTPPAGLDDVQTATIGNGFGTVTLVTGFDDADSVDAYASLLTSATGSPLPGSDVTYLGVYEVLVVDDIRYIVNLVGPDYLRGTSYSDSGTLALTADVSTNRLMGTDGTFSVLGIVTGSDLSGTVVYDGQSGRLDGRLFAEGGIAAFHGNDDSRVFAGGLTMVEDP